MLSQLSPVPSLCHSFVIYRKACSLQELVAEIWYLGLYFFGLLALWKETIKIVSSVGSFLRNIKWDDNLLSSLAITMLTQFFSYMNFLKGIYIYIFLARVWHSINVEFSSLCRGYGVLTRGKSAALASVLRVTHSTSCSTCPGVCSLPALACFSPSRNTELLGPLWHYWCPA